MCIYECACVQCPRNTRIFDRMVAISEHHNVSAKMTHMVLNADKHLFSQSIFMNENDPGNIYIYISKISNVQQHHELIHQLRRSLSLDLSLFDIAQHYDMKLQFISLFDMNRKNGVAVATITRFANFSSVSHTPMPLLARAY